MEHAAGASDSEGGWDWKSAYDACEAAVVLFLRKFGGAMTARAGSAAALLPMLARMARLLPSHTRRSVEGEELQQFSTPVPLALVASTAAAMAPSDHVLEPSAGTGLLAIFPELAGASLVLNELAETRAGLLGHVFPDVGVTRFDAARIDDHLDPGVTLLRWVVESVPPRLPVTPTSTASVTSGRVPARWPGRRSVWVPTKVSAPTSAVDSEAVELSYETVDWKPAEGGHLSEAL